MRHQKEVQSSAGHPQKSGIGGMYFLLKNYLKNIVNW